jgi:hypothetical protein
MDSVRARPLRSTMLTALAIVLAWFYVVAAREHARVRNLEKSRGDQTLYVGFAEAIYANRHGVPIHGQTPPILHPRNRMPLYPFLQSFFYDPRMSDWEFFYRGRELNIWLSLGLLGGMAILFLRRLRPLPAANLTLVIAFGYFVFKAGYFQPELLFYFLFFCTFLTFCHLLERRGARPSLWLGVLGGTLAALSHLTKAAMVPFVVLFLAIYGVGEFIVLLRAQPGELRRALVTLSWRTGAAALLIASFLVVLYPYISTSKRVFGQYFYNVNTTSYVWYDSWHHAIRGTRSHNDELEWPRVPRQDRPSWRKYWREHTTGQIANRIKAGLADMVRVSYDGYWYWKYVVLYLGFAALVALSRWSAFLVLVRRHAALVTFLGLYGVTHLLMVAFYEPISGTGTARFLLVHVAPLLFALSCLVDRPPFADARWQIGRIAVTTRHLHLFIAANLAFDLAFIIWPRLMVSYGGF